MLFTIYKNGEVWSHAIINTRSAKIALSVYCKANMLENNGEFTCDCGEMEKELSWYRSLTRASATCRT